MPETNEPITMTPNRKWSLGAKLTLFGAPLLLLVFLSTAATLWVSWQLDGGAAAVNEAGATLAGAFLDAGLVDEVLLYMAPVLLGSRARPLFDGLHIDAMAQRLKMRRIDTTVVGEDLRLLLRPEQI